MNKLFMTLSLCLVALVPIALLAQNTESVTQQGDVATEERLNAPAPDGVRPGGTIGREFAAPPIAPSVKSMNRPVRNYPEQPPVIPHSVRGYQIDNRFNRCLTCHSRSATGESGAPMISVTHFLDRDGQVLAAVSPRRYFCMQCHVPQHQVRPVKESTFMGVDEVLREVMNETEPDGER